jgi:WD40 repeat protein
MKLILSRSPTTEDTIHSREYPNVEASARWSTATVTILKSNVSANPAFPEQASTTLQPVRNTKGSLLDGKTLASASVDETVRIWDSTTGAVHRTLEGHSAGVCAVTFSPDGKTLASASGIRQSGSGTRQRERCATRSKAIQLGSGP